MTASIWILAVSIGGTFAHAQTANPYANGASLAAQAAASQLAFANNPYTVTSDTHLVLMEYEAWWGPGANHFEGTGKVPLLSSASMKNAGLIGYDSADPAVIQQHADWMVGMGIDAILLDESNGSHCAYAADIPRFCLFGTDPVSYHNYMKATLDNNIVVWNYYRDHNVALKIIPFLDGQDPELLQVDSDGQTNLNKSIARQQLFLKNNPNQWVYYQGKPLLTFFSSAPMKEDMVNAIKAAMHATGTDQVFTVRFFTCYADSQPTLWEPATALPNVPGLAGVGYHQAKNQYWSFIDRLRPDAGLIPIYAVANGIVEATTASIAFPAATGSPASWADPTAGHRLNYFTFQTFMDRAKILKPTFLVIDQWNEYVQPDQGFTAEDDEDIDPTDLWGTGAITAVGASLANYKSVVGGRVIATANVSSTPGSAANEGFFRVVSTQAIYYSNGAGHYCYYPSPSSFYEAGGTMLAVIDVAAPAPLTALDGDCHVPIRTGFFRVQNGLGVYGADGNFNYCLYPNPTQFHAAGGIDNQVRNLDSYLEFNKLTGVCAAR